MEQQSSRNWYVVYSKRHKEQQAQFHLGMKSVENFFPRLLLAGSTEKKNRIVPLFPSYFFVRIDVLNEAHHVIWTPGVQRFVSFGDVPIPVEPALIEFLQRQGDARGLIRARSQLKCGQEVEISGGPFEGLLGIIQDPPDEKGRVKVLLNLMNRQVAVNLGVECIRGEWQGLAPSFAGALAS
jgi:transcriptional antiterminator RfaH